MRESVGQPTLGFVHPLLYAAYKNDSSLFHDITVGNNQLVINEYLPHFHFNCTACYAGYVASSGFDAVTGMGSPNFAKLKAVLVVPRQHPPQPSAGGISSGGVIALVVVFALLVVSSVTFFTVSFCRLRKQYFLAELLVIQSGASSLSSSSHHL